LFAFSISSCAFFLPRNFQSPEKIRLPFNTMWNGTKVRSDYSY
jgi:hypothetical protein